MALFKPYKILSSQLASLPIVEGQLIITTDTHEVYVDISGTERQKVGSGEEIPEITMKTWTETDIQ